MNIIAVKAKDTQLLTKAITQAFDVANPALARALEKMVKQWEKEPKDE